MSDRLYEIKNALQETSYHDPDRGLLWHHEGRKAFEAKSVEYATWLVQEVDRLRDVLEDISMNVSMSMPLEWNDEASWYRSQFQSCIGKAARGLKP